MFYGTEDNYSKTERKMQHYKVSLFKFISFFFWYPTIIIQVMLISAVKIYVGS